MAFFTEVIPMSEEWTVFDSADVSPEDVAYAKSFWQSIQLNPPVESTLQTQKVSQRVKTNKSNASTHNTALTAGSIKTQSVLHVSPMEAAVAAAVVPRMDESGAALPKKLVEFYARVQHQADTDKRTQREKWLQMKEQQLKHMAALKERRECQRRYINESKLRPPSGDVIQARLNELPPELEEADWSDDIDGSKEDVIKTIKNLPG